MRRRRTRNADGDLLTLRQHQLPVKVMVFKNGSLAFVELEMIAAGILDFATDLHNPNFAKIAEAAGLLGLSAETADDVSPVLEQALNFNGPALVEIPVRATSYPCRRRLPMSRQKDSVCSRSEPFSTSARTSSSTSRK